MPSFRACVLGHPIGHSKSPLIHNHWMGAHGLDGLYEAIDAPPEKLHSIVKDLKERGFAGFNVTIPHKQAIMALCNDIDETARAIGAVNTVRIQDGTLVGHNTDSYGFIASVKQALPAFDFAGGPAIVLGAGGAARAVVHGLRGAGARRIILCNRTHDSAKKLADGMSVVEIARWEERSAILSGASILINTTSLGMRGQEALDIDLSALPESSAVCDIVYAPLMTGLLRAAQARGNPIVTGIGMLLHQAAAAFELWFGILPDVDTALTEKVLRA